MADNKSTKGGFTVQEIEHMVKKYRFEVFFCGSFILAALFSKIFDMMGYSILLAAVGGVISMLIPGRIEHFMQMVLEFVCKQEKITQIVMGTILLVISVVLSPVVFLILGLAGGKSLHHDTLVQRGKFLHGSDSSKDSTRGHS
jgi:xanthine/uracil permease